MMKIPMTQNEKDLWNYIRKLENTISDLRARVYNLEKEKEWHAETDMN